MFTGLIEEVGKVKRIVRGRDSARLCVLANRVLEDVRVGDSIAVNGVCLTVTELDASGTRGAQVTHGTFCADVMHETLRRSSLGRLRAGDAVNLERAMSANGRFGGHIVSGHIDGTGKIVRILQDDIAIRYVTKATPDIMRYIVEKGSVAIDGISLTVAGANVGVAFGAGASVSAGVGGAMLGANVGRSAGAVSYTETGAASRLNSNTFEVSVIPHTQRNTNLCSRIVGDIVNIECDIIGKYVEKMMFAGGDASNICSQNEAPLTKEYLSECGF